MMTLTHQTRIAVNVLVEDDTGSVAALIMALTLLVNLLVGVGRFVNGVILWLGDFAEAARFTSTVFTIGFKSLAFGMGVSV